MARRTDMEKSRQIKDKHGKTLTGEETADIQIYKQAGMDAGRQISKGQAVLLHNNQT